MPVAQRCGQFPRGYVPQVLRILDPAYRPTQPRDSCLTLPGGCLDRFPRQLVDPLERGLLLRGGRTHPACAAAHRYRLAASATAGGTVRLA